MNASGHALTFVYTCGVAGLLGLAVSGCDSNSPPRGSAKTPRPSQTIVVPRLPDGLKVPDSNQVSSHLYVQGVQIYAWQMDPATNQFKWVLVGVQAVLFNEEGKLVGYHCRGTTWESKATGREVKGVILAQQVVDTNAISWQLIQATNSPGPGMARATYIQRVNTQGGLPPKIDGDHEGQRTRVPFMAEDFFYRGSEIATPDQPGPVVAIRK